MRHGFTLIETLAILLTLSLAVGGAIALVRMAAKTSEQGLARTSAEVTAQSLLWDPKPVGLTADNADADGDGWRGSGSFSWSGAYTITTSGFINGYWAIRVESSTANDLLAARLRRAVVEVEVYSGLGGERVGYAREPNFVRSGAP